MCIYICIYIYANGNQSCMIHPCIACGDQLARYVAVAPNENTAGAVEEPTQHRLLVAAGPIPVGSWSQAWRCVEVAPPQADHFHRAGLHTCPHPKYIGKIGKDMERYSFNK